jgi:hypothetical protein
MARTTVPVEPEHYVPVPRHRLIDVLVDESGERGEGIADLCRLLEALLHFEHRELIEELKRDYLLFDPGSSSEAVAMLGGELSEVEYEAAERRFLGRFVETISRANFIPLTQQDLDVANAEDYLFSLPVEVDWDRYDTRLMDGYFQDNDYLDGSREPPEFARHALVFRRGIGIDRTEGLLFFQKLDLLVSRILVGLLRLPGRLLGRGRVESDALDETGCAGRAAGESSESLFATKTIERVTLHPEDVGLLSLFRRTKLQEPTFGQLVLVFRLRPDEETGESDGMVGGVERAIHIKTFVDIPMADLEVVFPEKRLSMKPVDLIKVAMTAVTGLVVVAIKLIMSALNPLLMIVLLSSLVAYAGRAIVGYRTSRARYQHLVTDALYTKSRDNGLGVLLFLVDCMEEQEWKEVLLGWSMLDRDGPCRSRELDRRCERWLAESFGIETDFEISDALAKLSQLEMVEETEGVWSACDLKTVLGRLDRRWDDQFQFQIR